MYGRNILSYAYGKPFVAGFGLCLLMVACAHLSFPYRFYGLSEASYANGLLIGPAPEDDLPLTDCEPTSHNKSPCVVMKSDEFNRLKQDHFQLEIDLNACQQGQK